MPHLVPIHLADTCSLYFLSSKMFLTQIIQKITEIANFACFLSFIPLMHGIHCMECQNIIILNEHELQFPLISPSNTLNIDQGNLTILFIPKNAVIYCFWALNLPPPKNQNIDTIFWSPMKKHIHRRIKKNGYRPSRDICIFKNAFLSWFGIFFSFFTSTYRPSLLFPVSSKCLI